MKRIRPLLATAAVSVLLAACSSSVGADGRGAVETQLVYRPLVSDRFEYRRVNYPQQVDALLVLANTPVVVEASRTDVYFWPITREYLADFESRDEPVDAQLEVVSGNGDTRVIVPRTYVLWYPKGVASGESEILLDDAAQQRYDTYVKEATAAAQAANAYQQHLAESEALVQAYLRAMAAGASPMPPVPPEFTEQPPDQYISYASEPTQAPIVSLPPGDYAIRLLTSAGQVIDGSERRLTSFAPRREGVGYAIVPERRWTQPTINFNPDETIYVTGVGDIFLEPVNVEEYPAALYARLLDPQNVNVPASSEYVWVPRGPVTGAELLVMSGDQVIDRVAESGYRVQQDSGLSRGYTILPYDPTQAPLQADFQAMRVATGDSRVTSVAVARDGALDATSVRTVHRTPLTPDWVVYAPALVPILLAALARAMPRRRRTIPVAAERRRD